MADSWPAAQDIVDLMEEVKAKYHSPRVDGMSIAVAMEDSKPWNNNRLNLGGIAKFPPKYRIWCKDEYDFALTICGDVWQDILKPDQKLAYVDLQLTRLEPVYEPETVMEGKKKVVVKDDLGRVVYTEEVKLDKNGAPKWQVLPLDPVVFSRNARRFGLWYPDLEDLADAIGSLSK